jgi:predicted membrane protein
MPWEHLLAILAGWTFLPALAWALAHEIVRVIRSRPFST